MSAPGTPKASEAAVAAVQDVLGKHQRTEVMDGERFGGGLLNARLVIRCTCGEAWGLDHVAVAAADAAAPHIAVQTLRDFAHNDVGNQTAGRMAEDLNDKADRIEAGQ